MNRKTYEALKRIMKQVFKIKYGYGQSNKDIEQIESWIDEVAKEYDEVEND